MYCSISAFRRMFAVYQHRHGKATDRVTILGWSSSLGPSIKFNDLPWFSFKRTGDLRSLCEFARGYSMNDSAHWSYENTKVILYPPMDKCQQNLQCFTNKLHVFHKICWVFDGVPIFPHFPIGFSDFSNPKVFQVVHLAMQLPLHLAESKDPTETSTAPSWHRCRRAALASHCATRTGHHGGSSGTPAGRGFFDVFQSSIVADLVILGNIYKQTTCWCLVMGEWTVLEKQSFQSPIPY